MKISIIGGAGCLGSGVAFNIVTQGLAEELVLVDKNEGLATLHVYDLEDTLVPCNQEMKIKTGNYKDMTDSDIIIITASVPNRNATRQEYVADNVVIMKDIAQGVNEYCPNAIILNAANPVEALNYSLYLLRPESNSGKIIGYSCNDHFRLKKNIAEVLGVKPSEVECVVLGEHGDSQVPVFSSVRVDGKPVTLDDKTKQDLRGKPRERMEKWLKASLERTSGWVSGVGMAAIVQAIRNDTKEMFICSAMLKGEYGYTGLYMSVPVILGREGILQIQEWEILPDERERLKQSVSVIKESAHYVEEALGITL